ncbi:MAG: AIPR family protein [Actinomyces bowdenii]|nr:AIPR family protein [Actinomyces bowdenii]
MEIQERQIRRILEKDFEQLIDMSDTSSHGEEQRKKIRTSRALAALSVAANAKLSVTESCASVVDESGDQGIDAIGIADSESRVYIVQAKTSSGGPSPKEVQSFVEGIRRLLDGDYDSLGGKLKKRRAEIDEALNGCERIVAIFSYLGVQPPNDDAKKSSDRLLGEVNSSGEILEFHYEGLKENFDHKNITNGRKTIDAEVTFNQWVTLGNYRSEIIGIVSGEQLAQIAQEFGVRLFDKNIRSVLKKSSETNEAIKGTLSNSPADFWYYNNGITIVATSIDCRRPSPRKTDETFSLCGISVVNGAQTCGALEYSLRNEIPLDDVKVTVRVISTQGHSEDFEKLVTRYTNMQNQMTSKEFVSLDPYQEEIRDTLLSENVYYSYRTGDEGGGRDYAFVFDLEEATRALACFTGISNATLAKREIGRMWADVKASPYADLFSQKRGAAVTYNVVRFWRYFNGIAREVVREFSPRDKRIAENSLYVCCTLMMKRGQVDLNMSEVEADVECWLDGRRSQIEDMIKKCVDLHEKQNRGGYPMSFFKNQAKVVAFAEDLDAAIDS